MNTMSIDPITLGVLQNGLQQVCNEMDLAFVRSAFSPVIAEALDRSDGIYHLTTGELIAQGELGLPVFVGTMQFTVQAVIERVQRLKIALEPGDVFIVNDPYLGGTHLMDVKFVQPFFRAGKPWCWLANTGHWPDTGGMVPGGFSANATEVEQEGLRLPPVKLYKRGTIDDEILSIILSNIRIADQRIGDIKAQAAALATGERRLGALLDRYGDATVEAAIGELKRRAARQMRERIATIPDGVYEGEAFVDSDGVVNEPLRIAMRITKRGQGDAASLTFDMSGSSPPCKGPMNSVIATTKSSIYLAVKHVFPEVSINAGTFEPLHIVEPEGTFLYARYPRPVSGCAAEVSQRIAEAVFAALGQAIPDQLFGAPAGTSGNLGVGGFDPKTKRAYVMYVISGGGYGGSPHGDGISNGCSTIGISKTTPIEIMEQLYPVLFEEYSLHEGSGGAGRHRGGFGVNYRIRLRRGDARVSMVMDHGRAGPPGTQGGGAGGVNKVRIIRDGAAYVPEHLSKDQDIEIHAGDVISVSTPGGGGFGAPAERTAAERERDVALGYYTAEESRRLFGTPA
jgi:N-methylhydantoinase B